MKVLMGVDPYKVSVAVAAVDEATGELLERAAFPQDRTGLRLATSSSRPREDPLTSSQAPSGCAERQR